MIAQKKALTSVAQAATISGKLARFAAELRFEDLPQDVIERARLVLLDGLGCALAGSATEDLRLIRESMLAAAGCDGDTLLWGTSSRAPLPFAALANAAAVHAREMDDFEGCLHSGSVIIPAACGVAARVGASGKDLIRAIVVGYDIARRALEGCGGNGPLKEAGWHSTSICGGFGAAAAAGCLLGLDAQRLQWALGYAGSNAGGTWAFIADGAMSKRVHPGFAAQSGIQAAYLAASGVTGPTSIFEAEWGGFFPVYAGESAQPARAIEDLGRDYRIRIVGFKPYAACRGTHGSIDSVLDLRSEFGLALDSVERVTVRGNATHKKQLGKQKVTTLLDAQFSIPYSISVALATGGAMLDQYSESALRRPEILEMAGRVDLVVDPSVVTGEQPFVDMHLKDGRVLTRRTLIPRGDRRNPLSEDVFQAKFRANAQLVLNEKQIAKLQSSIRNIVDVANVADLVACLRPVSV